MLEFLRQLSAGIREAWGRLSLNARVQIAVAAFLTFALLGGVVYYGSQPQFVRLYSRLDPDEANKIVVWLSDNDIPYRVRNGGTGVDVPVQHVQQSLLSLGDQGLPRTQGVSTGFELFSNRDLMTNQWLQNIDFMRALQGELQRQLNQFEFVNKSFVFVREATDKLFVSEQSPSTATVILDVNRNLTPREVKAVLHTVSSFGGANLSTKNVTLSLTDGTLLHSPVEDEFAAMASDKLEAQVERERERELKVEQVFKRIGVQAAVRVSALIDWTEEEKNERTVTDGVIISSQISSSKTTNTVAAPQGAPGALANIPEGLGGQSSGGSTVDTEDLTENVEPSETITKTVTHPGVVRKYLVAAFIEGNYEPVLDDSGAATGEQEYKPLTEEQITKYTSYIGKAVGEGLEATEIVVFDQPFKLDRLAGVQITAATTPVSFYERRMVQLGIQVLAMVAVFFVLRVFMRRALVLPTVEEEEIVELPEASRAELRRQEIATEVERLSSEQPEIVAALLRSWMGEDD